ncbi:MAG: cytochrome ubiquinol oxidase subunit I, partial [Paracoccaceae bacterium]
YAFLWTVAPNWPPPDWAVADLRMVGIAAFGALVGPLGIRLATARLDRGKGAGPGLVLALLGAAGLMVGALSGPLALPDPARHAYDATVWVIGGYALFHAALAALMAGFVLARSAAGFVSARRQGEVRIVRLWIDYAAVITLVGLAATFAPPVLR